MFQMLSRVTLWRRRKRIKEIRSQMIANKCSFLDEECVSISSFLCSLCSLDIIDLLNWHHRQSQIVLARKVFLIMKHDQSMTVNINSAILYLIQILIYQRQLMKQSVYQIFMKIKCGLTIM